MRYISTRGQSPAISFADMLLAGLAPDGGLYLPRAWPAFTAAEIAGFKGQPYTAVAKTVLVRLIGDSFTPEEIAADVDAAYASFSDSRIAPLSQIGSNLYLMELYHGPTLAFKDVALQILGRLFARALKARGGRATVLAATSGDTGSAAIAALGGLDNIEVVVLHPKGRVSDVQRRQMTTAPYANVHNIAIEGTFDDAQAIVKASFADTEFAEAVNLTAVNSINFARIAAQAVYYFTAAVELGVAPVFVVPTGNFGDVFAGEAAMRMGLTLERLVVATNANDIMARALNEGVYVSGKAAPTLSPSMDIQVASNFERALFEASGRNDAYVREAMAGFAATQSLALSPEVLADLRTRYSAACTSDTDTLATIARLHRETGRLIDPHTAVALSAAYNLDGCEKVPVVVLSTAHPAKFPAPVEQASGQIPEVPERLKAALQGEEKCHSMAAEKALVRGFIEAILAAP